MAKSEKAPAPVTPMIFPHRSSTFLALAAEKVYLV
jgi:hypothetical protein